MDKKFNFLRTVKKKRSAFFFTVFLFLFAIFLIGQAEPAVAQNINDPNSELQQGVRIIEEPLGLPTTDIRLVVARIIRVALGLVGIVLVVLIMYGGFLYMTAGGNEAQIDKAKKVLTNAIIGLIIILSAFAIVSFVIRMLGVDDGGRGSTGQVGAPGTQNFVGSGALGQIIRDHYPARNQTDVPRNTKIAVTFSRPILVENLVTDTNGNGVYGDCLVSDTMDWQTDCDAVRLGDQFININALSFNEEGEEILTPINGAALLASYVPSITAEGETDVYTIVLRPYDYLGSESAPVEYRVRLGGEILLDDPVNDNPPALSPATVGNTYYEWQFICGTELDLTPPRVEDAYPRANSREVKNTSIQISFNEAIDPIGVQGGFFDTTEAGTYGLQGDSPFVFLKNYQSTRPEGRFTLLNNYRTMEFAATRECGQNACGRPVYCLPVCDAPGADCLEDNYEILLRAGRTFNTDSFEAVPFSGIMDMAGNALDGNADGAVDVAPRTDPIFPTQQVPDNYSWQFVLLDELDLTSPYILSLTPGPEATYVPPDRNWFIWFSKRMRIEPIYSISLTESPTPAERCPDPGEGCTAESLWRVPAVWFRTNSTTLIETTEVVMMHAPFLDGLRQIYIPYITSVVEDVHYNCFYPGQGPVDSTDEITDESARCVDGVNCCINSGDMNINDFCCNGQEAGNTEAAADACRDNLRLP